MIDTSTLNNIRIIVDLKYRDDIRKQLSPTLHNNIVDTLSDQGFLVVAKSPIGLSVSAKKTTFESVFKTEIVITVRDINVSSNSPSGATISFSTPPIIPDKLSRYIADVKIPPGIIPLKDSS